MNVRENHDKTCPLCGGPLVEGLATIPFVLGRHVAVIKDVPAEICDTCGEPFLHGSATDIVTALLRQAQAMGAEVTVLTYASPAEAAA
jgi:YgiT-type zinc finger domain-containing protein